MRYKQAEAAKEAERSYIGAMVARNRARFGGTTGPDPTTAYSSSSVYLFSSRDCNMGELAKKMEKMEITAESVLKMLEEIEEKSI